MKKYISLKTKGHKLAYNVSVNDVIITSNRENISAPNELTINQWIKQGVNSYQAHLFVPPSLFEKIEEQYFIIEFVETTIVDGSSSEQVIYKKEWSWEQNVEFPIIFSDSIDINPPLNELLWDTGESINQSSLNLDDLKQFVERIWGYMHTKNFTMLEPLITPKAKELAQAYHIPIEDRLQGQREFFTMELFNEPGWGMQSIDWTGINIEYFAAGKLLQILDNKGRDLLKSNPLDGDTFSLPLFLAFKDNQWVICR
ncbi:MAG: hypothetical protein OCD01_09750 [Fibrobacterales bacterium]